MPDITMCNDKKCKVRKTCYRFMAEPSEMQSYFSPRKSKECKHYWECEQIPLSEIK